MLQELKLDQFERAAALFETVDRFLALRAAIEGNNPARIFVDDVTNPQTALALTVEGYLLAGDHDNPASNEALRTFFNQQILTGRISVRSSRSMFLVVCPDTWEARLPELLPEYGVLPRQRYYYLCRALKFDWRNNVPAGYTVRRFDQQLLAGSQTVFPDVIRDWLDIKEVWSGAEAFFAKGISYCVLHGQEIVAWCVPDCVAGDRIDLSIITHPDHRRRGLATVAVAATVDDCLRHGFGAVGWHCNAATIGSWKTAEKVGFERIHQYREYFYVFDRAEHFIRLAWHAFEVGDYEQTVSYFQQLETMAATLEGDDYHLAAEAWAALADTDRALMCLRAAAEHGWKYPDYTRRVAAFRPLYELPAWDQLLSRMAQNASQL